MNKIIELGLKVPGIKSVILNYSIGNNGKVYTLDQIPYFSPKFKIGDKVMYIGKDRALLDCEKNDDLSYRGYSIENNTSPVAPLGKDIGWVGFDFLKEHRCIGKVLDYSLKVPHWRLPKYLIRFEVIYCIDNQQTFQSILLILNEDELVHLVNN